MSERLVLSEEQLNRIALAAELTRQQLAQARLIVSGAGITNAEITAAVVHALAINFAGASGAAPKARVSRTPAKTGPAPGTTGYQGDLLAPDPLSVDPFGA